MLPVVSLSKDGWSEGARLDTRWSERVKASTISAGGNGKVVVFQMWLARAAAAAWV